VGGSRHKSLSIVDARRRNRHMSALQRPTQAATTNDDLLPFLYHRLCWSASASRCLAPRGTSVEWLHLFSCSEVVGWRSIAPGRFRVTLVSAEVLGRSREMLNLAMIFCICYPVVAPATASFLFSLCLSLFVGHGHNTKVDLQSRVILLRLPLEARGCWPRELRQSSA
jgi:hypothetical protein